MKIALDNQDSDDNSVLVTTDDRQAAIDDQSIMGSSWEAPEDMLEAYAIIDDRPGLVEALKADGYEVDESNYFSADDGTITEM